MLLLTRKLNEVIYIGDIVVTVVAVNGNRVQIGIKAPDSVPIMRAEIVNEVKNEC